nr:hypothetical protein [Arthrobacter castelli]
MASQQWGEVIELAYEPALVAGALEALAGKAKHWTLVSSVSVYASNSEPNADESADLLDPVDLEDYGQAKVAAERVSREALGDRLLIVRPELIAGAGDGSDRFSYWVSRFPLAENDPILTPVTDERSIAVPNTAVLAESANSAASARSATGTRMQILKPILSSLMFCNVVTGLSHGGR